MKQKNLFFITLFMATNITLTTKTSEFDLFDAAHDNDSEKIKTLLADGINVEARTLTADDTALIIAAAYGSTQAVEALLAAQANVHATNKYGTTALIGAAKLDTTQIVEIGANKLNITEIVKMLLAAGSKVNTADVSGNTPLICATAKDHAQIVRILLTAGANVDTAELRGLTPLMFAAGYNHDQIVNILLEAGANIHTTDRDGDTALVIATNRKKTEAVKALLKAGARIPEHFIKNPTIVQAQREIHNDEVRAKDAVKRIRRHLENTGQNTGFASELANEIKKYL